MPDGRSRQRSMIWAAGSRRSPRATMPPWRSVAGSIASAIGGDVERAALEPRFRAHHGGRERRHVPDRGQHLLRWRDVDPPVRTHLRVRGVLMVATARSPGTTWTRRAAPWPGAAAARPRSPSPATADTLPREVMREMTAPADPGVQGSEEEQQEPQRQERCRRTATGSARPGPAGRSCPTPPRARPGAQLDERECADRQDEQLHRHTCEAAADPPARRPVVPPGRSATCTASRARAG